MHYAFPPRKTSNPPKPTRTNYLRRTRLQFFAVVALCVCLTLYLVSRLFGSTPTPPPVVVEYLTQAPRGQPNVVIVTPIDPALSPSVKGIVQRNREDYAARHGYKTFFPDPNTYHLSDAPKSWATVPAMRHAMTKFPQTPFFFFLGDHALIMNYDLSVEEHIMEKGRLESIMLTDIPVVPPDSVIKTFAHLKGDRIDFVLAQDKDGLACTSFIIRRGEWAKYFLDAWFDPLYRSYNFQKAERHALEHIVQWHGTILAKLALVPQKIMNSYTEKEASQAMANGEYKDGDFIINLGECDRSPRSCEEEMQPYAEKLPKLER
ncbi:alpha-1,2-galactosyltransferase gmh3 [Trichodelitschia bisporula]|uniref:Alpha-1,2-galactosyltransferase gmh3 n=1 Tax=Trichodelitschia bisporula TaxID=703511 RepID=A0A6G1I9V8_9PEZI|nr:alpha-1,2-galactosyltransferase gmh3 [Trichodelitschia bisporula]